MLFLRALCVAFAVYLVLLFVASVLIPIVHIPELANLSAFIERFAGAVAVICGIWYFASGQSWWPIHRTPPAAPAK